MVLNSFTNRPICEIQLLTPNKAGLEDSVQYQSGRRTFKARCAMHVIGLYKIDIYLLTYLLISSDG